VVRGKIDEVVVMTKMMGEGKANQLHIR
jgi:hypothetical protein